MNLVPRKSRDLVVSDTSEPSRELSLRRGSNDYQVEIVRRGTFYEGYVSQLQPGDAFQFMEGSGKGRWFGVINPIKMLPGLRTRYGEDPPPIFQFDGLEIMQAAPTIERRAQAPALPAPDVDDTKRLPTTKRLALPAPGDIDDVDFTEKDL